MRRTEIRFSEEAVELLDHINRELQKILSRKAQKIAEEHFQNIVDKDHVRKAIDALPSLISNWCHGEHDRPDTKKRDMVECY